MVSGNLHVMNPVDRRPRVALLVTDLDNTLYDWFTMWYSAFSAMIESICVSSRIPKAVLLPEIRRVYQEWGTSEYSHLLDELPSLRALNPGQDISEVYKEAIHKYRSERKRHLKLYPSVRESLLSIKRAGVPIAVYTESLEYYSFSRLRELRLDGIVDYLYSPEDHGFPEGITPATLRTQEPDSYSLKHTIHRFTAPGVLKPDTEGLLQILDDIGVPAANAAYVGDSLMKDVAMAQDVKALDVLAEYGAVRDESRYNLLREVSHWTQADVDRERIVNERKGIEPNYKLRYKFDEILDLFDFGSLSDGR